MLMISLCFYCFTVSLAQNESVQLYGKAHMCCSLTENWIVHTVKV